MNAPDSPSTASQVSLWLSMMPRAVWRSFTQACYRHQERTCNRCRGAA